MKALHQIDIVCVVLNCNTPVTDLHVNIYMTKCSTLSVIHSFTVIGQSQNVVKYYFCTIQNGMSPSVTI